MSTECIFCNLGSIKGVTSVNDDVVMFEPLNPVTPGHRLFVHRRHTKHAGRNPRITGQVFEAAAEYGAKQLKPFNLITSAGEIATQTVFHLHVHYVPRAKDDGLMLPWSNQHEQ